MRLRHTIALIRLRHVHLRHPWRSPYGGFAVQIGNPADLSFATREKENRPLQYGILRNAALRRRVFSSLRLNPGSDETAARIPAARRPDRRRRDAVPFRRARPLRAVADRRRAAE